MFEGPVTGNIPRSWTTERTRHRRAAGRVTAELASKLDSSALAPAIAPLASGGHQETPDGVDLKLSNYSTLGQQRHAGHGGRQLRPQDAFLAEPASWQKPFLTKFLPGRARFLTKSLPDKIPSWQSPLPDKNPS